MIPNVPPAAAWSALQHDPQAQLCDVRTAPEWHSVGVPDLAPLGKQAALIPWQQPPTMRVNPEFLDQLAAAGFTADQPIYFICRSGVRSLAAAQAARAAGYRHVFNVAEGYEGHQASHGAASGWKAAGLPCRPA